MTKEQRTKDSTCVAWNCIRRVILQFLCEKHTCRDLMIAEFKCRKKLILFPEVANIFAARCMLLNKSQTISYVRVSLLPGTNAAMVNLAKR